MEKIINIKDKDVISIVGSGGKTSLMNYLAKNLINKKVLVSTTTKIRIPKPDFYDFIAFSHDEAEVIKKNENKGIYVFGSQIKENKLESFNVDYVNLLIDYFDNLILEADGAKEKLIKGWNDNEPIIVSSTTKTIGVVNLDIIGQKINDKNVHRVNEFIKLTNSSINETLDEDCLFNVITNPNGLFKNALGEKILFINGAEGHKKKHIAENICDSIIKADYELDCIVVGSILEGVFFKYDKY